VDSSAAKTSAIASDVEVNAYQTEYHACHHSTVEDAHAHEERNAARNLLTAGVVEVAVCTSGSRARESTRRTARAVHVQDTNDAARNSQDAGAERTACRLLSVATSEARSPTDSDATDTRSVVNSQVAEEGTASTGRSVATTEVTQYHGRTVHDQEYAADTVDVAVVTA